MGLLIAPIEDGKIVDTSASGSSLSSVTKKDNSSLDKEAFLQLLVAQMKYQDPLEPTSNTEYVSQLATFSSLEEMQNMNSTMEGSHASSLVGKQVIIKTTSTSDGTKYISGQVDYIVRENGKTYLSVQNGLYSIDDLDTVVDDTYLEATNVDTDFKNMVLKLPNELKITLDDKEKVEKVRKAFDDMTDYQKEFIKTYSKEYLALLTALEEKLKKLEGETEPPSGEADPPSGETPPATE